MATDPKVLSLCATISERMNNHAPPSELYRGLDPEWLFDAKGEPEHARAAARLHELQRLLHEADEAGLVSYRYESGGVKTYFVTDKGLRRLAAPE